MKEEVKRRIILLGPPGAGKGTHAKDMAEALKVPHISTGDILREAVKLGIPVGREAKSYMERGELVPDGVMANVVLERLAREDCREGFILDGFPRTAGQWRLLEEGLSKLARPLDVAVEVTATEELIVARLAARRICRSCGAVYNLKTIPPKVKGRCDVCQGELYQRPDDQEQTVRRRLEVYREQSEPLVVFFREKGILKTVDGGLPRDAAFALLMEAVL